MLLCCRVTQYHYSNHHSILHDLINTLLSQHMANYKTSTKYIKFTELIKKNHTCQHRVNVTSSTKYTKLTESNISVIYETYR